MYVCNSLSGVHIVCCSCSCPPTCCDPLLLHMHSCLSLTCAFASFPRQHTTGRGELCRSWSEPDQALAGKCPSNEGGMSHTCHKVPLLRTGVSLATRCSSPLRASGIRSGCCCLWEPGVCHRLGPTFFSLKIKSVAPGVSFFCYPLPCFITGHLSFHLCSSVGSCRRKMYVHSANPSVLWGGLCHSGPSSLAPDSRV